MHRCFWILALPAVGCSTPSSPPLESEPATRALEAPGSCTLSRGEDLPCDHSQEQMAMEGMGGFGGSFPETSADAGCWLREGASLSCPSFLGGLHVARGEGGELDVLVEQLGRDGLDEMGYAQNQQAYLSVYRLERNGEMTGAPNPVEPYSAAENPPTLVSLVPGGPGNNTLIARAVPAGTGARLSFIDPFSNSPPFSDFELPDPPGHFLKVTPDGDDSIVVPLSVAPATSLVLGAPASSTRAEYNKQALNLAFTRSQEGELLTLVRTSQSIALYRGEDLDEVLWEEESNVENFAPDIDLRTFVIDGEEVAFLVYPGSTAPTVNIFPLGEIAQQRTVGVGYGSSSCNNWTVGIV